MIRLKCKCCGQSVSAAKFNEDAETCVYCVWAGCTPDEACKRVISRYGKAKPAAAAWAYSWNTKTGQTLHTECATGDEASLLIDSVSMDFPKEHGWVHGVLA